MSAAAHVRRNPERSRFELVVDGDVVGILEYGVVGDTVVLLHTEIDPSRRGQGLAAMLVQYALDEIRGAGQRVVPQCWYVAQFVDEHPQYRDLIAS